MIIVVSGLMRSGTSALAQIVHELGVPMGNVMRFPQLESSQPDWEDVEFTDAMLQATIGSRENIGEFMLDYIEKRGSGTWGVKSPFLLPHLKMFKTACQLSGHDCKILMTSRNSFETIASLRTQIPDPQKFEFAKNLQDRLIKARHFAWFKSDLVIDMEEMRTNRQHTKCVVKRLIRSD